MMNIRIKETRQISKYCHKENCSLSTDSAYHLYLSSLG